MADENALREKALDAMMASGYGEVEARQAINLACDRDGVIFEDDASLILAAIEHISKGDVEAEGEDYPEEGE